MSLLKKKRLKILTEAQFSIWMVMWFKLRFQVKSRIFGTWLTSWLGRNSRPWLPHLQKLFARQHLSCILGEQVICFFFCSLEENLLLLLFLKFRIITNDLLISSDLFLRKTSVNYDFRLYTEKLLTLYSSRKILWGFLTLAVGMVHYSCWLSGFYILFNSAFQ